MEGYNNQEENSSEQVQQLLSPEPHQHDSVTNPQTNNSGGVAEEGARPSLHHRARGRPLGSKNKPKHPILATNDNPYAIRSHVLEISAGADVIESLNNYARQRGVGISILNGSGIVSNVTVRESAFLPGIIVTLHGYFNIVSVNGMVHQHPNLQGIGGLSILLSGGQGKVLGGNVVGPLIAISTVLLTVISFSNAVWVRLPLVDEEAAAQEDTGGGANQGQQVQPRSLDVGPETSHA